MIEEEINTHAEDKKYSQKKTTKIDVEQVIAAFWDRLTVKSQRNIFNVGYQNLQWLANLVVILEGLTSWFGDDL